MNRYRVVLANKQRDQYNGIEKPETFIQMESADHWHGAKVMQWRTKTFQQMVLEEMDNQI